MKHKIPVVMTLVCALAISAYALTRMTGIQLVNSTVDSTPIGNTTPSTAKFTSAAASLGFTGNLFGNATTATALSADPPNCTAQQSALGIAANGTAQCRTDPQVFWGSAAGCDTPAGTYQSCTQTITLSGTFGDTTYIPVCTGFGFNHEDGSDGSGILYTLSWTTSTVTVETQSNSGNDFYYTTIKCQGFHY
jgi:hypothetical protein